MDPRGPSLHTHPTCVISIYVLPFRPYWTRVLLALPGCQASAGSFLSSNQRYRPGPPACPGLDRTRS